MLPFGINELPHFQGGRSVTMCCCQGGRGVNTPTTSSQGTARTTISDAAASAVVTAVTPAPTVSPKVLGPRLLLIFIVWPTFSAWRAKAWATRPAPMMPMSMVMSFLLYTCSYNDPGFPWSRNVRDGFVEDLPMGSQKYPCATEHCGQLQPIHRQKGASLSSD